MNPQIISESEARVAYVDPVVEEPRVDRIVKPGPTAMGNLILLARKKRLIFAVTAAATFTGVAVSLLWPVRYTATTEIMTPQQTESAAMMLSQFSNPAAAGSMAALASSGLSLKSPNDAYIGMLSSRTIADAIIQKFDIQNLYRSRDMTAARKKLANRTQIASEKSGFISISVTDADKFRAAQMANEYTEQLRSLTQSLAAKEASQRRAFFEERLREAKKDLVEAEASFQAVQQTKGVIQPADQAKVIIESLSILRANITAKKVELQALRSYLTDRNPQVMLAENQLASMQAAEAQMEQKQHSGGFSKLGLGDVPGAGLEYLNAQHEVLYRQTLFDLLIKQYDAARLDEAKAAAVIRVVSPAIPPDRKSSPLRALIVVLFLLSGLAIGCAWVYADEHIRQNPESLRPLTDLKSALIGK